MAQTTNGGTAEQALNLVQQSSALQQELRQTVLNREKELDELAFKRAQTLFIIYLTAGDSRVRPDHGKWNYILLPVDHPSIEPVQELMNAVQKPNTFACIGNQVKISYQGFMITGELGPQFNTIVAAEKI